MTCFGNIGRLPVAEYALTHQVSPGGRDDFVRDCPTGELKLDEFQNIYKQFFPTGDPSKFASFVFNVFDDNRMPLPPAPTSVVPRLPDGLHLTVAGLDVTIERMVTHGSRMRIYVVEAVDGRELVMKELLPVPRGRKGRTADWERDAHEEIDGHPAIVKYITSGIYREDHRRFMILMEYAPYGDLRNIIAKYGRVNYFTAWQFFGQIVAALGHIHSFDRVHRGVHPRNVFVFSEGVCKLGDFGNGAERKDFHPCEQRIQVSQSNDVRDAVTTLLYMVFGQMPSYVFLEDLKQLKTVGDASKLLHQHGYADLMPASDLFMLKDHYDVRTDRRPIPVGYVRHYVARDGFYEAD
ncbi:hypothetical protein QR680_015383 [Steinernema hermaphroditum]|uniref:Protein kinase domain-containing protein n=1 Tax=Steinernema hermaphroditum TaxID=289476 RepID=A0AA39LKR3_9BILA|nr:hypothetical protein QR680_015383 [Steinernema hermaphroditum]